MKLPNSIEKCPILEAVFEIRFASDYTHSQIFAELYSAFKNTYIKNSELDTIKIPEEIRNSNEQLKYAPAYRIENDIFKLNIGQRVLSLNLHNGYIGWEKFRAEIVKILSKAKDLNLLHNIERASIRYVNFFEADIFDNITIKFHFPENLQTSEGHYFQTVYSKGDYQSLIQLVQKARVGEKQGAIIDIDTSTVSGLDDFCNNIDQVVDSLHDVEKETFFCLLTDEFVKSLQPEY